MSCPFAKFATLLAPMTKNSTADQKAQFESIHGFAPPSATFSSQPGKVDLVSAGFTLSEALRVGTAASHRAVEKSKGVSLLLSSLTTSSSSSSSSSSTTTTTTTTLIGEESVAFDRLDYVRFNIMLVCIYAALESAMYKARLNPLLIPLFEQQEEKHDGELNLVQSLARTRWLLDDISKHLLTIELHTGADLEALAQVSMEQNRENQNDGGTHFGCMVDQDVEDDDARKRLEILVKDALSLEFESSCCCHDMTIGKTLEREHFALLKPAQVKATLEYVSCLLLDLKGERSGLLISHAYTRYLGDLSGGQHIVKKLIKRFPVDTTITTTREKRMMMMMVTEGKIGFDGFMFYNFKGKDLKKRFKEAMEKGFSTATEAKKNKNTIIQSFINEANRAFDLNTTLFESLLPANLRINPVHSQIKQSILPRQKGKVKLKPHSRVQQKSIIFQIFIMAVLIIGVAHWFHISSYTTNQKHVA
ncbi:related to Heme oxygenase [Melanopsichium pennsylvanicum]|uniref:Related to Heme oxygenase n=1 Tax=Melanopsichium pennsylvanicum TaxID=63383 RepID=A0AAJ4XKX4_9BASI|nr:related to Heme oxygenase [Melanopsichium pennsylvanicum]